MKNYQFMCKEYLVAVITLNLHKTEIGETATVSGHIKLACLGWSECNHLRTLLELFFPSAIYETHFVK